LIRQITLRHGLALSDVGGYVLAEASFSFHTVGR